MLRIAIVDDSPDVVALLTKWVADVAGEHQTYPYYQLAPALAAVAEIDFDLVVSDVDMGDGSDKFGGVKIAKALNTRRTPLLVVTGYTVPKGVFDALDAWEYMQKPIDEASFKREVERALMYRKGLTDMATPVVEGVFEKVPNLSINRRTHRGVHWKGVRIHLPMSKIDIIETLAHRAGQVVSHKELFEFLPTGKNMANLRVAIHDIKAEFKAVDPEFDEIKPVVMSGYMWRVV